MTKTTEAKCDGLMLTVGFPTANPPLIWRFDLERNHSFTLSLQGEEGDWELGVTSPKGDFYPVAHFVAREEADDALAKVGKALAQKRNTASSINTGSLVVKTLTVTGIVIVCVMVVVVSFGLYIKNSYSSRARHGLVVPQVSQQEEGVPLAADDVLKPPR